MDLNVRVIKAVECCPTLYKGHASIEERQVVWQQLSEQMRVPESVLKTRWHLLCSWYQRCLEKRRSTDDTKENQSNSERDDFRYENEMTFMMPYIHARITIAAANAARKQQELVLAGAGDLTEPEFVITENDIEIATTASNELSADYAFYEVDTFEQDVENLNCDDVSISAETIETETDVNDCEYIHHIDESGNIILQDIIYESCDQLSEDGGEIEIGEDDIIQMDDKIEVQNEQTIEEEVIEDESHSQDKDEFTIDAYDDIEKIEPNNAQVIRLPINSGQKYIKLVARQPEVSEVGAQLPQERTLMTGRRPAVVLKATPRVQVELTDNPNSNVVLQNSSVEDVIDCRTPKAQEAIVDIDNTNNQKPEIENANNNKDEQAVSEQEQAPMLASTAANTTADTESINPNENSKTERSEDTIFGELVTAMLKQMPPERKRTIKKSIMDLLLT